MRVFRKSLVVSFSLVAFIFMLPFELIQGAVKGITGENRSAVKIVSELYADVCYSVEECLKMVLPDAAGIKEEVKTLMPEQKKAIAQSAKIEWDPEYDNEYHFYVSSSGVAMLNTVKGKWGPIRFMAAFDNEGRIKDVVVMELTERRGKPVKEPKFLNQYKGKSIADPIKLNKDIKGIAGATISSRQMSDGVRKATHVYEELYRK